MGWFERIRREIRYKRERQAHDKLVEMARREADAREAEREATRQHLYSDLRACGFDTFITENGTVYIRKLGIHDGSDARLRP